MRQITSEIALSSEREIEIYYLGVKTGMEKVWISGEGDSLDSVLALTDQLRDREIAIFRARQPKDSIPIETKLNPK